ncbi:FtsH protease activity modulator HflK [Glaciimonas immobilis]|uniref:Protein HflK n=1 Tax=Glaciimonas immobilis TaxID=728004 RepID=A0A840RKT2_9BURK|nr:FtsH protease activity modulator HflK [Glaciimonas immobilis]KAF3998860.1 FtsH protease activity modulator HflK [Glaciimonas immobilis]MBB5198255.1 membrane protease subunit HflK [Glaciimonas immobilis]
MLGSIFKKIGVKFSLNDPQWGRKPQNDNQQNNDGKKPNNGPPDLDQLWRDFNQRLNRFFGNKNNGGGGSGDSNSGSSGFPSGKNAGVGVGIIGAIVIFLWVVSGFFTVQEGQTGVVMTFGKYSHSTMAGVNWRWPYPIQSHEIVNVSGVRTIEVGYRGNAKNKQPKEALMLTEDENIIDIQFAVQYKLKSAADWLYQIRNPEETVRQVAEAAVREVVGKSQMDFVLYEGREKVALDVGQLMQQILDHYKSGVQVTNVTMQGVQPPEQVQAAFDDAVKAGQDRERQKNEGQAYANDVIPKARGAASRLLQEAEAYSARVTANAEGDASRFRQVLTEYQKAPAVTRDRMYLDTMQQIFANTTKVMIDAKSGNNLLYLPLEKLIAQSIASGTVGGTSPSAASGISPATAPVVPLKESDAQGVIDSRSRDNRNRESR